MVIYLPAQASADAPLLDELTPREIVASSTSTSSDKPTPRRPWPSRCATASAARSWTPRWRRGDAQEHPHDRTHGVGKTELARRLAKLANSPFLKVEASKLPRSAMWGATSNR